MRELKGQQQAEPENFWIHRENRPASIKNAEAVSITVTDLQTGLYVKFNSVISKSAPNTILEGPYLTYGKQFLVETKSPQLHNTAVKIWR
jgi:hypothetical protein